MIISTDIEVLRNRLLDIITNAVKANKSKEISTYYINEFETDESKVNKKYPEPLVLRVCADFKIMIQRIFYHKKDIHINFYDLDTDDEIDCLLTTISIDNMYKTVKWLQRNNFLNNLPSYQVCYYCGSTKLQRLAYIEVNNNDKVADFYDKNETNYYCPDCQHNTSGIEVNKTNIDESVLNHWWNNQLENITKYLICPDIESSTSSNQDFKTESDKYWNALTTEQKRDIWSRYSII